MVQVHANDFGTKYFNVPEWHIIRGKVPETIKDGEWITKALTQEKIGKGKFSSQKKLIQQS